MRLFIPPEEIRAIVRRLAKEIRSDYAAKDPVLIGVLKGACVFLADLAREIDSPLEIDFVQTSGYGKRDTPAEKVAVSRELSSDIKGRDVIVVDGIIDRGRTVAALLKYLSAKEPASVRICALLLRDGGAHEVNIDYVGATIKAGFVVGYGMDYRERYRNLPAIYFLGDC
ncbi:MAG: hypoxanthine phosphoribosyltransferase [Deltaproteobacteria bacterium]|nr:hypoxanthine phosphoribosyltransferase [Deltaproteobacteria bacterium]